MRFFELARNNLQLFGCKDEFLGKIMNTDCYYEIGSSHIVCEDYALVGKINDNISYAIVSDGCSASNHVDVGARILAHSAKEYLQTTYESKTELPTIDAYVMGSMIVDMASLHLKDLNLSIETLDCTLLIALSDGNRFSAFVYGDGGVIVKRRSPNANLLYHHVTFESGAPYYLSYLLSPTRNVAYGRDFGKKKILLNRELIYDEKVITSSVPHEIKNLKDLYDECMFSEDWDFEWIALVSDGVESYQRKGDDGEIKPIPHARIIQKIGNYKNLNGQFVQRRMTKLKRDCLKEDIVHYDDMSIATIHKKES